MRRHRSKNRRKASVGHRSPSRKQTPLTTENTEITERIPRRSSRRDSDPESFDPSVNCGTLKLIRRPTGFSVFFSPGSLGSLRFIDLQIFLKHLRGLMPRPRASVGEGQQAARKGITIRRCTPWPTLPGRAAVFSPVVSFNNCGEPSGASRGRNRALLDHGAPVRVRLAKRQVVSAGWILPGS